MTDAEILQKYGLPVATEYRDAVRQLLEDEISRAYEDGDEDQERRRLLCAQLFSIGNAEDCLLIWEAKAFSFDTMCGLDIQFLCGAGLEETKTFLQTSPDPSAPDALEYLLGCETAGDFRDWTPQLWLVNYQNYFGVEQ